MSSVSVKEVQSLNKRIEKINTERTRVETRTEMLKNQLVADINAYKEQFGVDLYDKDFNKLRELVKAESEKVMNEVSKEYELKEKVVSLIEEGNIEEANKLLNIGVEVEETPENSDSYNEIPTSLDNSSDDLDMNDFEDGNVSDDFGFGGSASDDFEDESTSDDIEDESAPDDFGFGESTSDDFRFGGFNMSVEDDDSIELDMGNTSSGNGMMEVEDDDDPFGFGDLLKGGTKF